jgi:DNA-binding MarR family transcriptional regulator
MPRKRAQRIEQVGHMERAGERQGLIEAVAQAIAKFQTASDLVDEAASERLGIHDTDRRLLRLLFAQKLLSAGRLAREANLSPGATTAAVDRLEQAGLARRVRDSADRRGVLIELTAEAHARIAAIYEPVGRLGMQSLARYDDTQLRTLLSFLAEGYQFQVEQAQRIRSESDQQETTFPT